ncbi:MAG: hypothetical protein NTX33_09485 [Propionibacteriales bacterium]|nr:hypothetical protein [Propionibacteriales bacterium]
MLRPMTVIDEEVLAVMANVDVVQVGVDADETADDGVLVGRDDDSVTVVELDQDLHLGGVPVHGYSSFRSRP